MAKGFIRRPWKHQPSLSPLRPDPSLVPAPSRTMPCGSSLACSPREIRGDPVPQVTFHLRKLVGLAECQGPGREERCWDHCSAAGSVTASIKAPQEGGGTRKGRPVGEGR